MVVVCIILLKYGNAQIQVTDMDQTEKELAKDSLNTKYTVHS